MNNIFQKNISALIKKDADLALRLSDFVVTEMPQLVQENEAYNFLYKNIYLHNRRNPLDEAKEIFSMAKNEPVAIHLVFGIGLGYLFQVASANSQGTVILYEPDLNILKIAFTLVDFSNDILKNNVQITDNLEKLEEYIYQKSNMKNIPLMLTTNSYRDLHKGNFDNLVEYLQRIIGTFSMDLKFTKEKFYNLTTKIFYNIPKLLKEVPLIELKDFYKGKTAVVVSAGPTLDRNIEIIKKNRDKIVLIVVGTAMKTVAKNDIVPDFLTIIETFDCSKQIEGLDLSQVNFITEPISNENLRRFEFKNTYSHISSNNPINTVWSDLAGLNIDEYFSKGTVSYTALNTARILGCSKIILVGQDLAYIEGQCYSKDSAYKDLVCSYNEENNKWEIIAKDFENFCNSLSNAPDFERRKNAGLRRLKDLNGALYYVKGINGDRIPTEAVYATFIKPLTEFTQKYSDREYINTSLVGAQIDGFKNISLEEALNDAEVITDRNLPDYYDYNVQNILDKLLNEKNSLDTVLVKIQDLQKNIKNLNNEIKRYRSATIEVLKSLKKISVGYLELSSVYSQQNRIFDFITTNERIDLDYEMKMTKELTPNSIQNITEKIAKYCEIAEKRIFVTKSCIEKTMGNIK